MGHKEDQELGASFFEANFEISIQVRIRKQVDMILSFYDT